MALADEREPRTSSGASPSDWVRLGDDDEALQPSTSLSEPLAATAPTELNIAGLSWENFEKLIARLAAKLESTENVHLYGRRGQRQDGIDVVCFPASGEPSLYQAKRRATFGAKDLREAVEDYVNGLRPVDARRFVVAVACDAHDTETIRTLQDLRDCYDSIEIEFWDRQNLSRMLVEHAGIVEQFFGPAVRQVFCGVSAASPDSAETLSDFVSRGPLRHLGLMSALYEAEQLEPQRPAEAAEAYAAIAHALDGALLAGYGNEFRLRQADALRSAGNETTAHELRLEVAWSSIDSTEIWESRAAAIRVHDAREGLSDSQARSLDALESVIAWRLGPELEIGDLAEPVDAIEPGDAHRQLALLALAEEAVSVRRLDIVQHRVDVIEAIVDSLSLDDTEPLVAARLRCCVADATGGWSELWSLARMRYTPEIAALVSARWGRYAALQGDVDLAVERYQQAIRAATDAQNYGDASAWLYALRSACLNNDRRTPDDIGDVHRLAQTVRTRGDVSVVPHGRTRTQALAHLNSENDNNAYEAIRRHIRHSTISASLAEETEAHMMFGQLLARTGRTAGALWHYATAGDGNAAAELADQWPEAAVAMDADIAAKPLWERAAALAAVTAFEDRLEDANRAAWAQVAMSEILRDPAVVGRLIGRVPQAAYETLAVTASAMSADDAERFVEHVEALGESGQSLHFKPEGHTVDALYEIARRHPQLAERAVEAVMRLLLESAYRANIHWDDGYDVLQRQQHIVREHLTDMAQAGDLTTCIVMAAAGCVDAPVIAEAKRCLDRTTAPPRRAAGGQSIGTGFHNDAFLVGFLGAEDVLRFATAMMELAVDPEEPLPNRGQALTAARVRISDLPEAQRSAYFATALGCAQGLHDGQGANPLPLGSTDPLSRFRISFGPESLQVPGLACASVCAITDDQQAKVRDIALDLLKADDEYTTSHAANAAAALPPRVLARDVAALRLRRDEWARWLAAVTWAGLEDSDEQTGHDFACDASPIVRTGLADALRDIPAHEPLRQLLLSDVRRSVRDAASTKT